MAHAATLAAAEKFTVLVVDDDVTVCKVLQRWLDEAGYKTLVSNTGAEGWQLLQDPANKVSLVITDVNMPGEFDGFGLLDRIVKNGEENGVGVIMMSGEKSNATRGVTSGSNDFMTKPLIKALMLKKVEMLIQHRTSLLQLQQERAEKEHLQKEILSYTQASLPRPTVETPMQSITNSLSDLLSRAGLDETIRAELLRIRAATLSAGNLYKGSVLPAGAVPMDAVTRSYLQDELAVSSLMGIDDVRQHVFSKEIALKPDQPISMWTFNVFDFNENELLYLTKQIFVQLDLLQHFSIPEKVFEQFLLAVRENYRNNPYHNWRHAFDVTQACCSYIIQFDGQKYLTRLDILALLVASLCHDLDHPGVSNTFMTTTASELALLYNDNSVLENHHASSLFRLLQRRPDADILASLDKAQFKELRKSVIEMIVATDSSLHYEYVTKLSAKAASQTPEWDANNPGERLLLLKCIIKMADISNVARLWEHGFHWSELVTEEFFAQGDRERSMGFPVAAFLDRTATSMTKNSMNFIDFVAAPFFKAMGKLDKQFDEQVVSTLIANRARWEAESKTVAKQP